MGAPGDKFKHLRGVVGKSSQGGSREQGSRNGDGRVWTTLLRVLPQRRAKTRSVVFRGSGIKEFFFFFKNVSLLILGGRRNSLFLCCWEWSSSRHKGDDDAGQRRNGGLCPEEGEAQRGLLAVCGRSSSGKRGDRATGLAHCSAISAFPCLCAFGLPPL